VRGVLIKAFTKLFSLYGVDRQQPSFDVSLSANLVLYNEEQRSYSFFFGQDWSNDGRETLSLTTIYRVDALSDVANIPSSVALQEFADCFERIFGDTQTVVHSVAAVVYIIRLILPDFRRDSVVGNKLTKLF
jgi:hypothetical protein